MNLPLLDAELKVTLGIIVIMIIDQIIASWSQNWVQTSDLVFVLGRGYYHYFLSNYSQVALEFFVATPCQREKEPVQLVWSGALWTLLGFTGNLSWSWGSMVHCSEEVGSDNPGENHTYMYSPLQIPEGFQETKWQKTHLDHHWRKRRSKINQAWINKRLLVAIKATKHRTPEETEYLDLFQISRWEIHWGNIDCTYL